MSPIKLVIVTAQTVTMYNSCGQEYSTTEAEDARRDSETHSMADRPPAGYHSVVILLNL